MGGWRSWLARYVDIVEATSSNLVPPTTGRVVKLVYTRDLKSLGRKAVRVQLPPRPPEMVKKFEKLKKF